MPSKSARRSDELQQRIEALEQLLRFVNDKIDFVMQIATAQVMPPGGQFDIEPPRPVTIPLAELYIKVRRDKVTLNRHDPQQSSPVMP